MGAGPGRVRLPVGTGGRRAYAEQLVIPLVITLPDVVSWPLKPSRSDRMTTMSTQYSGPATIRLEDGTEVAATVSLVTRNNGRLTSWGGIGSSDDFKAMNSGAGTIVLPTGAEGDVIITNSRMTSSNSGISAVQLTLLGSGDEPY